MKSFFAWQPLVPPKEVAAPQWIRRAALIGAVAALACGLLQVALGLDHGWALYLPLVVSALLFGLPHGAIDHLVALGLTGKTLHLASVLTVAGVYLMLAILYGGLWLAMPGLALSGFLAMTVYHWGKADTVFEIIRHPDGTLARSRMLRWIHTALRGSIPIGLPLLAFPGQSADFLRSCLSLFMEAPVLPGFIKGWIAGFLLTLFILELLLLLRAERTGESLHLTVETVLLLALFTTVPPLAAIGWYFCLWHGLRHVLRLCRYSPDGSNGARTSAPIRLFLYRALPFTLLSLLFLALAGLALPTAGEPARWIALYLVLISTLTFPHIILVEWMDLRVERPLIRRRQLGNQDI